MKKLILFLSIGIFGALGVFAQTPYDNFAPEQSVKSIIELPQMQFRVENTNTDDEVRYAKFDKDALSLTLLDDNENVIKTLVFDPNEKKFLTMDPLAEKYYSVSPYAFSLNNPIRFIDPNGMDVYRFDDKTGEMHLFQVTDDKFDQIGQFKYDKKTDTYTLKTNRKGEARTRMDNVEKGILSDGMNFMTNDNMWAIGGAGQPTVKGFQDFAIGFAEMINKEVSGYYLNQSGAPDVVSNIYMGRYINNNATMSKKGVPTNVNRMTLNGTHQIHTDWHTHPTNAPTADRLRPSGLHDGRGDIGAKKNALGNPNPNQRPSHFMILTRGYAPIYY